MVETLKKLVENNYKCITELFYFGNLPYIETAINGEAPIAKVSSDEYKSLSDIEGFLNEIYIPDQVEELMHDYFEGALYLEHEGTLCLYANKTTSAGIPIPWKDFEIEIINVSDSECEFLAVVQYRVDDNGNSNIYRFKAINNNGWKLEKVVVNPDVA